MVAFLLFTVLAFGVYRIYKKTQQPELHQSELQSQSSNSSINEGNKINTSYVNKLPIDDRVDFIPRVSHRPESAPAFDHLRKIIAMPVVAGGLCQGDKCTCITQQGTNPGISNEECRAWVASRPFDYYRQPELSSQPAAIPVAENPPTRSNT